MPGLRERNRRTAMRDTQRAAVRLFEQRGFDHVTVEEVADAAGISPSTIYRHFGTKEALVVWDEHEGAVDAALAAHLGHDQPWAAMRAAFVEALGDRYDGDEHQLARVRYLFATPQVHGAALRDDHRAVQELIEALELVLPADDRAAARLLAGAAMLAIDTAFDRWQAGDGARPVGELLAEAFDTLGALAAVG